MQQPRSRFKLISYITVGGLILFGYLYIGLTKGFTAGRSLGFLAVVWVFVFIAIQSNWVKAPSRTARFPFTNLNVKCDFNRLLWAASCLVLGIAWSSFAGFLLRGSPLNNSWIGVFLAFGPLLGLLGLFLKLFMGSFEISIRP